MSQAPAAGYLPLTELWFNILLALTDAPRHGYGLIREIEERTGGMVSPAAGTIYLALARLEENGLIEEVDPSGPPSPGRPKRSYALSQLGRKVLELEAVRLANQVQVAIEKHVLDAASVRVF